MAPSHRHNNPVIKNNPLDLVNYNHFCYSIILMHAHTPVLTNRTFLYIVRQSGKCCAMCCNPNIAICIFFLLVKFLQKIACPLFYIKEVFSPLGQYIPPDYEKSNRNYQEAPIRFSNTISLHILHNSAQQSFHLSQQARPCLQKSALPSPRPVP